MTSLVWPQNDDYPYRAVVWINVTFPNGLEYRGSGVMVGENDVLTASHLLYRSQDGGAATSVTIYPGYDNGIDPYGSYVAANWFYYPVDPNGDGLLTRSESQYDVGIVTLATSVGNQTGWFGIDPNGTSGNYNLTGYPTIYSGLGGARMTNDDGFVTNDPSLSVFNYDVSIEANPGNSGGPLWYQTANGPYVVGIASTTGWAADVGLNFSIIMDLIEDDAALIVFRETYGFSPNDAQLNSLHAFVQPQFNHGTSIGVANPILFIYEALGLALCGDSNLFASTFGPLALQSDATFAARAYELALGFAPGQAQIDHFVRQVDYFESIYAASGAYGTDPVHINHLARGAIYGQILGLAAELDFLT